MYLEKLAEFLKLVAPITAGFGLLWKYFLKKKWDDLVLTFNKINDLLPKLERIDLELKPNGGSTVRDAITRIEHQITIQNQQFKSFLKVLPYGTFTTDKNGSWTDVNLTLCKMLNCTESELLGMNWINLLGTDDLIDTWEQAVKHSITISEVIEYQDLKYEFNVNPMFGVNNEVLGFFGTIYDIN